MIRALFAVLLTSLFLNSSLAADEKPNFLWLISEDNSKHYVRLFDPNGAPMPNIEAIAKEGLVFEHAFSNSPVCSVARTTLITSCYGPRIGTQFHRRSKLANLPGGVRMFPAYLRDAGYYTTNKQKKDYNAVEGQGVWDASSRKASWRNRKPGQPFFHKQSFGTTHESSLHFSKQVMKNQATQTDPKSVTLAPYHPDTPTFRYTYARYHDRIQQVDREMGRVIDALRSDGLLESTFIFYFGDHGGVLPRSKGYAYESGLHVPLVVRVPEKFQHLVPAKRGSRLKGFVSFIDFGPTLLRLAGLPDPKGVDGRAFLGKGVELTELESRDEAFGYADRFDEKWDLVRTLRKGRFKYTRNYQPFNFDALQNNYRYKQLAYEEWRTLYRAGKLNAVQKQFFESRAPEALYDIENDPHETKNLAADPKYAVELTKLRARFRSLIRSLPDLSLFPENYLFENAFTRAVPFGQERKSEIAQLADTADLALKSFGDASAPIAAALASENPWIRYWGVIAATCHGKDALSLKGAIQKIAKSDPTPLVRVRAAEFIGLLGLGDPQAIIRRALTESKTEVEMGLILNSVVMLRDGKPGYPFQFSAGDLPKSKPRGEVERRKLYLAPESAAKPQPKKKRKNKK
ncbi:MAG: sulfatase [Planctomycetota bacterium]